MSQQPEVRVDTVDSGSSAVPNSAVQKQADSARSESHAQRDLEPAPVTVLPASQSQAIQPVQDTIDGLRLAKPEPPLPEAKRPDEGPPVRTRPVQIAEVPPLPLPTPSATLNLPNQTTQFSEELLRECEQAIGYQFKNRSLLEQSLTHASISKTRLASNERLEFLGDSIMGAVVCEHLYKEFPEYPEGELTRIKSSVVSRHTCAKVSADLKLGRFLALGKGLAVHDRIPTSILSAAFESVIAAMYLDGGWEPTQRFIVSSLSAEIKRVARSAHGYNFKSMLQQTAQKSMGETPVYKLLNEKGPDHSKNFQISAAIGERLFPPAWGPSKKEAEQNAASNALDELKPE